MQLLAIDRADSGAPSLKQVGAGVEVPVLKVGSPDVTAPVDSNVLFPVTHIDLMGHQAEVFPPVVPDVAVNVVDVTDRLCLGYQEVDNTVLKIPLITKVDPLVSSRGRRFNRPPVLGAVIRVLYPEQFSAVRFVSDATQKIRRYLLDIHTGIIPFQQAIANYG